MRIILAHKFHHVTGGADFFYFEVARVLIEKGHSVAFFSTVNDNNLESEFSSFFVESPDYINGNFFSKAFNIGSIVYSKKAKCNFSSLIKHFNPDLIHVFSINIHLTPSIFEAASEASVPVVMSCNDYKHICPNYKIYDGHNLCESCKGGKFYNAVLKMCCKSSMIFSVASSIEAYVHAHKKVYDRFVDRYLFASEFMLNKTKEFWPEKSVQYGILKNPFDPSQYKPIYQGDYALYFGRIIDEKGVDRIVEAAKKITIPIKIVGDGPDLCLLQSEAAKHNLTHISFLGAMWGENLNHVLYGARFVIVPSLWHENFPYVVLQAFAAGKPVIGSLRGGIPELLRSERGLLFDPEDIDELASCMDRLWKNDEQCRKMGKIACEYVIREFSDDVFYKSLMENYSAVQK